MTLTKVGMRVGAVVVVFSLLAAACGDDDDADGASSQPTAVSDNVAAPDEGDGDSGAGDEAATADDDGGGGDDGAPEPEPQERAGTLIWANASNGANFYDPHRATNPFGRSWMYPFYDRLTRIDADGALQPMLATSWEFSEDGASLTFSLREGVTFHDGTPFDAEAAKANLDRARDPDFAVATFVDLAAIESVDVVDDLTVRLNLLAPGGALPAILSDQPGMMISPAAFDNEDLPTMPVGAGPFVATEFRVDEVMHAVAFDDYWDPELPKVAELELRFVLDSVARVNGISSGELHGGAFDFVAFSRSDADDLGVELTDRFSTALYQLYLNTDLRPEFANPEVRRALAMAIDQAAFSEALLNGECTPTDQVFGEGWYPRNPDIDADFIPYDPEEARAELERLGVADLEFDAVVITVPSFVAQAEAISGFLADAGVTMNVVPTSIPEIIGGFIINKTIEAYWSFNPGAADPAKFIAQLWLPQSPFNPGGYEVPGLVDAHLAAQVGTSEEERASVYHDIAELLAEEQLTVAVCTPSNSMAHRPEIGGVELLSTVGDVDVARIFFEDE